MTVGMRCTASRGIGCIELMAILSNKTYHDLGSINHNLRLYEARAACSRLQKPQLFSHLLAYFVTKPLTYSRQFVRAFSPCMATNKCLLLQNLYFLLCDLYIITWAKRLQYGIQNVTISPAESITHWHSVICSFGLDQ